MPSINGRTVALNDYVRKHNGISGYVTAINGDALTFTDLFGTTETLSAADLSYDELVTADIPTLAAQLTQLSAAVDQLIMDSLLGGM